MFRHRKDTDFTAEIQAHIELEADRLREQGIPEQDALRAARRAFGNVTAAQERFYYRYRRQWWDHMKQDVRYAVRVVRRSPGFSAVAVLCLALGIGAATAIFSLVDGVLLRPLAYRDPGRLYLIRETMPEIANRYPSLPANAPRALAWREQAGAIESLLVAKPEAANLTGGNGEPERVQVLAATASFFAVLGVQPRYGRAFLAGEEKPGHAHVVVLTHPFWRRHFHGDLSVLGKNLTLDGNQFVIVGILPPSFTFPRAQELGQLTDLSDRLDMIEPLGDFPKGWNGDHDYIAIARTRPGVSEKTLLAQLNTIEDRITRQYKGEATYALVRPLQQQVVSSAREGLLLLLAAVLCLLLIVCLNVANLFLARARARRRELAVRLALGAGRRRLLQQLLTETVLLSGLGGLLGIWLGWAALQLIHAVRLDIPRIAEVQLDGRVVGFALLLTIASGLIVGALPALRLAGEDPQEALKSGSHTLTESARSLRVREALVAAEVAISAVLLIVAGLLVTSLGNVLHLNQGFTYERALAVDLSLPATRYRTPQDRVAFLDRALERLRRVPGVESAAFVNQPPLTGETHVNGIILQGREQETRDPATGNLLLADFMQTSPGYFHTLGIPLLRGRDIADGDRSRHVAVVSARLAELLWPGENPIGKRLREDNPYSKKFAEVIGVAADVRNRGVEQPPTSMVYIPYWERNGAGYGALVLRTPLEAGSIAPDVHRVIWSVDPQLPLPRMRTMGQIVAQATFQRRFQTWLGAAFAVCALLVAALGIYGIVAYTVVQRRTEFSIRIALGARKRDVHSLVLRQGARPVLAGLSIGVPLALAAGQLVRGLLFGVTAHSLPNVAATVLVLLAAGLLACYWPARRATRIDPSTALRYD